MWTSTAVAEQPQHGPARQEAADSSETFLDLVELVSEFRRRWRLLLLSMFAGLLLAILYLNISTPRYGASLRLTPASSTENNLSGALGRLGGLASLAGIQARQGSEGATPFELFLDRLYSRELAGQLVADREIARQAFAAEWDSKTGSFRDRPGLLRPIRNLLYWLAGQEAPRWRPPDAERMQNYLEKNVVVTEPGPRDPPITTVSTRAKDPLFATRLLQQLHHLADTDVRTSELARARESAAHLATKLAETNVVEHRVVLAQALLEQERSIMLATSSAAFAATQVEPASSSERPVSPLIIPTFLIGCLLGLFAGIGITTTSYVRRQMAKAPAQGN